MKSNNYNFIAPVYDQITRLVFFGSIQKAQLEHLNLLPEEGKVLFIGGGTGFALQQIMLLKPNLKIDYLDQSVKMIQLSKEKIRHLEASNVNFITGNESSIPKTNYDGIVSFFYFDLLPKNNREAVFTQLYQQLKLGGIWLFSYFHQAKSPYEKLLELVMYSFLQLSTNCKMSKIPPLVPLINAKKLQLVAEKTFHKNFIFSFVLLKSHWNKS